MEQKVGYIQKDTGNTWRKNKHRGRSWSLEEVQTQAGFAVPWGRWKEWIGYRQTGKFWWDPRRWSDSVPQGRKEEKERKTVPNGCVSKGLSVRDGGLKSIEQIGKIEWLDESEIWNLKFYYFWQHGSTLKNGDVNDIFCLDRPTNNACSVLDLLTWRWTLSSPLSPPNFLVFLLKKGSIYSLQQNLMVSMPGGRKQKPDFHFYIILASWYY